jgi:hypothetical protein
MDKTEGTREKGEGILSFYNPLKLFKNEEERRNQNSLGKCSTTPTRSEEK